MWDHSGVGVKFAIFLEFYEIATLAIIDEDYVFS
jgi:hypothetical protein